ncbi:MAG TPA: gamma-glutamyltransferase [Gaiellaceae bacterium]|nr:gamma-glutamyltransferase [Gaiellaceae bacterium]
MRGAIAAGHPLTAQAGAAVLAAGGNAVDACLAAAFAAAVAEGPLTGPAGGGFLLVAEPGGDAVVLDCFFAVPAEPLGELEEVVVDFEGSGTQVFRVGEGSVAVPGLVQGLEEAHRRYGSRPWRELVRPAAALAREGVAVIPEAAFLHRILAGILHRTPEGRRIYGADRVHAEGLAGTLELLAERGSAALPELLPELADELARYAVRACEPVRAAYCGSEVLTAPAPSRGGAVVAGALAALDEALAGGGEAGDARLLADALRTGYAEVAAASRPTGTTHVSVVDGEGLAASLSSTLASGSGVFRHGFQLNNMLGELDIVGGEPPRPGDRLPSMMAPTIVRVEGAPRLVVGSAGSVRVAGAIVQVVHGVVGCGLPLQEAVCRPRVHVEPGVLHVELGARGGALAALEEGPERVARWDGLNLYFGGVQAVARAPDGSLEAAGDPRRGGAGVVVT